MVTLVSWCRKYALAPAIAFSLVLSVGYGQQPLDAAQQRALDRQRALEEREMQTAANKWMKVPVDASSQPNAVSSEQRQARDAYWDNLIGASRPLWDPNALERPLPLGDTNIYTPEIGDLGDGVLLIGKFESYRAILSTSQRSVYTEIQMRVQHVFGHPDAPVRDGAIIDIARPGGTVIAPWGTTVSYWIHPQQTGLQPEHIYLIRLGYIAAGNFYIGSYSEVLGELWDLTDGIVKPGNYLQKQRAEHGMSKINGLSTDALIQALDKKFYEYYQKGR